MAAFGESRMFPAFFSSQSGFQAPYRVQDEEEAAKLIGVFQQGKAHVGPGTEGQKVESFFVFLILKDALCTVIEAVVLSFKIPCF